MRDCWDENNFQTCCAAPKTDHHEEGSFKVRKFDKSHGVKFRVVQSVDLLLIEISKMQSLIQLNISEVDPISKCISAVFINNFRNIPGN